MQWLFNNFDIVLYKYIEDLLPLRKVQEKLSSELREIGLSGNIHGCIVDIDFYHHIMLNPYDGTITFYYSPQFGLIENLDSFEKTLISIKQKNDSLTFKESNYDLLFSKYKKMAKNPHCLLNKFNKTNLLENFNGDSLEKTKNFEFVSRSEGMYGLSREANYLQRIFTGRVLREFDLDLVETSPKLNEKANINM